MTSPASSSSTSPDFQWTWYRWWIKRTVSHSTIERFDRQLSERLHEPDCPHPNVLAAILEDLRNTFVRRLGINLSQPATEYDAYQGEFRCP